MAGDFCRASEACYYWEALQLEPGTTNGKLNVEEILDLNAFRSGIERNMPYCPRCPRCPRGKEVLAEIDRRIQHNKNISS